VIIFVGNDFDQVERALKQVWSVTVLSYEKRVKAKYKIRDEYLPDTSQLGTPGGGCTSIMCLSVVARSSLKDLTHKGQYRIAASLQ
jgi:hypothetical protein